MLNFITQTIILVLILFAVCWKTGEKPRWQWGLPEKYKQLEASQPKKDIDFANIAVFIIFFGIALVEAIQKHNWLEAALFAMLGAMPLWADFRGR